MDTPHDDREPKGDNGSPSQSLPPFVAYQVEEESRENIALSPGDESVHFRQGKVEAETHRVSEEVTREARARRRAVEAAAQGATVTAVVPSFPPATTLPAPRLMRRFLVPLDGSLQGERALPYASALASILHAYVVLAHVTPTEPPEVLGRVLHLPGAQRLQAQQASAAEALPYLQRVRNQMALATEQVEVVHVTAPDVARGLGELEKSRNIDLVFVAPGVHSDSDHMRAGRVADSLIRFGTAPVVVVPPEADAGVQPIALHHILVTLDGSPLAEQALGLLMGLIQQLREANGTMPAVTLFAVAEDYSLVKDYQAYLDAISGVLARLPQFEGVRLETAALVGSAAGAIVGAVEHGIRDEERPDSVTASAQPFDMVIMTTHGRGGMSRWLYGSVADYVLPRVHVPVLLMCPRLPANE